MKTLTQQELIIQEWAQNTCLWKLHNHKVYNKKILLKQEILHWHVKHFMSINEVNKFEES